MPPPASHIVKPRLWWSRPLPAFGFRRAAELAAPEHERGVEQAAALQVLEQAGDGLVGLGGHAQVVLLDVARGRPTAGCPVRRPRRRRRTARPCSTRRRASRQRRP